MKPLRQITRLLPWILMTFLAGCGTAPTNPAPTPQQARIGELSEDFEALPAPQQARVTKGAIDEGFSYKMVYMALGEPYQIETSADGQDTLWTYHNIYPSEQILKVIHVVVTENGVHRAFRKWNNYDGPTATYSNNRGGVDLPPQLMPRLPPQRGINSVRYTVPAIQILEIIFMNDRLARIRINDRDVPISAFEQYGQRSL